ncbi:hypothetical protein RR42_m2515 [Cupriavidus basilensis]|uniref:Uncharacterized protein n=1 Tax=Cupriavidus basilensis TaxID=68895 RepID=A0A0C4Y3S2_9BURK|nr:hypothetical protein RR42_m2515 [Cupriavidus basilensis]
MECALSLDQCLLGGSCFDLAYALYVVPAHARSGNQEALTFRIGTSKRITPMHPQASGPPTAAPPVPPLASSPRNFRL